MPNDNQVDLLEGLQFEDDNNNENQNQAPDLLEGLTFEDDTTTESTQEGIKMDAGTKVEEVTSTTEGEDLKKKEEIIAIPSSESILPSGDGNPSQTTKYFQSQ